MVACPSSSATDFLFTLMVHWCLFDLLKYFPSFFFSYVKRITDLSWGGGLKVWRFGPFLSSKDRDPHPTCARCRSKICTKDMTCDFCVGWTPGQWELFAKKRTYKERKRSRPSGSVPPLAPGVLPRAGTSSEVLQPGTSSSVFSRLSGGQDKMGWGGGSQGALGVVSREASSTPARPRSSERGGGWGWGGSVSGHSSVAREHASVSSAPSGAGRGRLLVRSGLPLPAPLPRLPLPIHHSTLRDMVN